MIPERDFGYCDFYIASRFQNARVVEAMSAKISSIDPTIRCIQTWTYESRDGAKSVPREAGAAARVSRADLAEIDRCQFLIVLTENCDEKLPGGLHVEFGYALGRDLRTIVIGPRMNVFHYLPEVLHYDTIDAFLADVQASVRMRD